MRRIPGICIALILTLSAMAQAFELPDAVVTASELNVRRRADISSDVFWKLRKGNNVKVKAINGEWYKVRVDGDKEGYVHYKYLDVRVWGRVFNTGAWVYNNPDNGSQVIADLRGISWVRVTNRWQQWYGVELPGGNRGWVYQDALEVPNEFFAAWLALQQNTPPPSVNTPQARTYESRPALQPAAWNAGAPAGSLRFQIVETARQYMGTPYVYGGETPSGFDCSGFVLYVFKQYGIPLQRVSSSQATMGTYVPKDQLQSGDLVFFDTRSTNTGQVRHVGIYIGNGQFIHSSSSHKDGRYVRISPLNEGFYSDHYVTGRRILN